MAEAAIEERQLLKSLHWYDGFVIALCQPAFLLGTLGFTLATVGAWGSVLLWGISASVGLLQNFIYSETAAMFPDKPGGIALYAHEGWRSRFSLFGPIAAFGYWIGWSVVLSFVGNIVGALVVAQWLPDSASKVYFNLGFADFGPAQLIAAIVILAVWLFNVLGVKPSLWLGYVTGGLLMVPLAIFIIMPYITGDFSSDNLQFVHNAGDPASGFSDLSVAIMWLFILCWSAYGIEVCATFAPEYHDTKKDTAKALKAAAAFSLFVYIFLPLGLGGTVGSTGDYGAFYVGALEQIAGSAIGGFAVICLIASLVLAMNTATADGGRALYGIARDDMTVKWLYHLNRHHVPGRGMSVDMVVNIALLLLLGANNFVILYISNIGYVFCHVLALTGFLLLRKDRPDWPRPIKVGPVLIAAAWVLAAFNLMLVVYGVVDQKLASYLGFYEFSGLPLYLGVGVLVAAVLLYFYRRVVEDKSKITFRDTDVPTMPNEEQMALLREESTQS
ncbi:MAG: APC family permease [Actinomycetota bacterium]